MNKKHFAEMLGSFDEAVEIARGQLTPARAYTLTEPDAREIRRSLGLTQVEFAALLNVPVATVQGYEQGRRTPDAPARALLRVALAAPELLRSLHQGRKIAQLSGTSTPPRASRKTHGRARPSR